MNSVYYMDDYGEIKTCAYYCVANEYENPNLVLGLTTFIIDECSQTGERICEYNYKLIDTYIGKVIYEKKLSHKVESPREVLRNSKEIDSSLHCYKANCCYYEVMHQIFAEYLKTQIKEQHRIRVMSRW